MLLLVLFLQYEYNNRHINYNSPQHVQIKNKTESIIVSKRLVLNALHEKAQIVSLKQDIHKEVDSVDDNFWGRRITHFTFDGSYIMGLDTSTIKLVSYDNGIVNLTIGKPILINLDLPYDKMQIKKTSGWLRGQMTEDQKQQVYSKTVKQVESEILHNQDTIDKANTYNERVVNDILMKLPGIKQVYINVAS
jgi:hypothetical protein